VAKLSLDITRWTFAALSVACLIAVWLLDLRSGPALGLLFLFILFGASAVMLSVEVPRLAIARKRRR
jgi:hypothetical protein